LTREGLAASSARCPSTWENLAKRMVDCQAPGLAGNLHHIADVILRDPDVDTELPLEIGRLHLLLHAIQQADQLDDPTQAELRAQIGGKAPIGQDAGETIEDHWFIAGRRVSERDRLITSSTWLFGTKSQRWARLLRFAPVQQTILEPWPLGATVHASLKFHPGLYPLRANPENEAGFQMLGIPSAPACGLDSLLESFGHALACNPLVRSLPFLISLRPSDKTNYLTDSNNRKLPWTAHGDQALIVDCICGGRTTPMCGEWDGRSIRLLAIADGATWIPLAPQQP
nr:hypothetical protein [Akkermansiaceae bacterium]